MKQIKLREVNSWKYCPICTEKTRIVMQGLNGYCKKCLEKEPQKKTKLYTLDNRWKNGREIK